MRKQFLLSIFMSAALLVAMPVMPGSPPSAGKPVDTCALLGKADVESVLGPLAGKPMALPSDEPLRNECIYTSSNEKLGLSIGTAPASEFDVTVQGQGKGKPPIAVPGLGQKAFQTQSALLIQPAGKPYFLIVAVMTSSGGVDAAKTMVIARKLKL